MAVKRTGVYTLTKLLITLCNAIIKFRPILYTISSGNPALVAALAAAEAACEVLRQELDPYKNSGV